MERTNTQPNPLSRLVVGVLALFAVLAVAACFGGDEEAAPAGPAVTTAAAMVMEEDAAGFATGEEGALEPYSSGGFDIGAIGRDVIIEMAESLGVSTVVTLGALLTDTHHNAPVNVVGASNNTALNLNMGLRQSTYEGPTGIIGVLNDACHRAGFDSVSFWATVPTYVHNYPSPKAALALAERVGQFLGVTLGESELHSAAANYGRQIDELVAGDDTLAQYAQQILEESAAEAVEDFSEMVENPDGLIDELEQFLRQQEPD